MRARSRSSRERSEMFSASSTSTSFSRLASRRCAPFSSVWATIVMRAISSFSVGPTVNESMLMARRRASEATRFRTPALFSTYATSVCIGSFWDLRLRCCFHERAVRPANHFMQRPASRNHGVNRVFLFHAEIDEHAFGGFASRTNRGNDLGSGGNALSANAEGVCERRKIGGHHWRCDVALIVEKLLPLANHSEEAIVDDGDVDFDFLLHDGG